jgi:hypothetical protein
MHTWAHGRSANQVTEAVGKSLANASPKPFWLDSSDAPEPLPALAGRLAAELAIVGGGFTGLWTALLAKERDPSRDVVLLEARTVANAASGRNGGFCSASLTHGLANGLQRFPQEMPLLDKLGEQNLSEIAEAIARTGRCERGGWCSRPGCQAVRCCAGSVPT